VRLHRALAVYADEVQQHRIDGAVWLVRERSAQYEEGLAQSKSIAAQWDGLMDTQAKVLADYHAAGIKRSDIAEFFKALGLVSIGVGVAQ
jgi:sulfur transfer protein SufE